MLFWKKGNEVFLVRFWEFLNLHCEVITILRSSSKSMQNFAFFVWISARFWWFFCLLNEFNCGTKIFQSTKPIAWIFVVHMLPEKIKKNLLLIEIY